MSVTDEPLVDNFELDRLVNDHTILEWSTQPPPKRTTVSERTLRVIALVDKLKEKPEQWAIVYHFSDLSSEEKRALSKKLGAKKKALKNRNCEVVVESNIVPDGKYYVKLWARYVGEQNV